MLPVSLPKYSSSCWLISLVRAFEPVRGTVSASNAMAVGVDPLREFPDEGFVAIDGPVADRFPPSTSTGLNRAVSGPQEERRDISNRWQTRHVFLTVPMQRTATGDDVAAGGQAPAIDDVGAVAQVDATNAYDVSVVLLPKFDNFAIGLIYHFTSFRDGIPLLQTSEVLTDPLLLQVVERLWEVRSVFGSNTKRFDSILTGGIAVDLDVHGPCH